MAQTGAIVGRVLSGETGEPISGAHVQVQGSSAGALSNMDGRYMVRAVDPGVHSVTVQVIGFAPKTITSVEVQPGGTTPLDVSLQPAAVAVGEIRVSAAVERGSTTALMAERRKASAVVDAIGAEQIARSPDGDAAAVLARAPGVSVVDGGYVLIRGLGDRYGAATLNGSPMPSPEPDKKTVPLDIVPASFLESVVTAKTYSPDQQGDYAGGIVQIRTRNFPQHQIVKVGGSLGYNPRVTGVTGLGYDGGSLDFLAYDDGTRDLPAVLPSERLTASNFNEDELEQYGEAFLGTWAPSARVLPIDQGFSLALGNHAHWFGGAVPVGYLLAVTQSTDHGNKQNLVERVVDGSTAGENGGEDVGATGFEVDYLGTASTRSASLGGMVNFSIEPRPTDRITLSGVYNRNAEDEARVLQGFNNDFNVNIRNHRIRYSEQELMSAQLRGEHEVSSLGDLRVEWRADLSRAGRYEPNTRDVLYRQTDDGRFLFETFVESGSIFHSNLDELGYGGALDLRLPFTFRRLPATVSLGGAAAVKDRESFARRFRFLPQGTLSEDIRERDPNSLFDSGTVGPGGFQIQEATFPGDNYEAEQVILGGYAMVDLEVLPRLQLSGGVRVEQARQVVSPLDRFITTVDGLSAAELDDTDLLPGINLTYELSDRTQLRAGFSRTVARPQFRELAPFQFTDYAGGYLTIGNPALERTAVTNYDARWEWFPGARSLVAVSAFYKEFEGPIESVVLASTELIRTWINAGEATNYGAEMEARTDLGLVHGALTGLGLNANLALIHSDVQESGARVFLPFGTGITELARTDRSRPLEGQSPYVLNVGLDYASESLGTRFSLLYNQFGRRIETVGDSQIPDVYEEGRGQLDLVVEQPFGNGVSAKISGKRLLGSEVEFTQDDRTVGHYDLGREISLSGAWTLGG